MAKFADEFKTFVIKGNPLEMAVGILIGISFNKMVNSLVNDILMPPVGFMIGGVEFKHLQWVIRPERVADTGETLPAVTVNYGAFGNTIVELVIVALSLFVVVKLMNRLIRRRENEIAP